ncbi:sulfite exporter TauE/SafE family protein [Neomegalonema sp.]|uniref:sulfite exporter TauE/SafE family protein n=1 Tax=Neomegalonema sp. TaxID=2039713 RepID=UPI002637DE03|nr:sulfite exporter TauE/SafE family protein [Neomegalonema sp.]MDD2867243.1 sulfite exporter TauE/SafE family protein [Neomegalonema sp.]
MSPETLFWVAAAGAAVVVGVSKGGFAPGAGFLATPMLALTSDPATAAAVMLPLLCLMDLFAVRSFWRLWDARQVKSMALGSLAGVGAGWAAFHRLDADSLRLMLGALALGFVVWNLVKGRLKPRPAAFSAKRAGFWGALAGFASFSAHAGGPPATIHLLSQNLDKTRFQATMAAFFAFANLIKLPPYAALGLFRTDVLTMALVLAPLAPLSVWAGAWAHRRLSDRWFFGLTQVCLLGAGLKLVWDGAGL